MEHINILQCGNRGALDGIILTALSLAEHSSLPVMLYIGTMDLTEISPAYTPVTEEDRVLIEEILKDGSPDSRAMLIDMTDGYRRELFGGRNEDTRYTPYAMLRLLADRYPLPDRLIYLDCDVMLARDIAELWRWDMGDAAMCGVLDRYGRWFIHPRYMNSGVMLWSLDKLRHGALAECRRICRERRLLLCDQTAINIAVKKKRYLPRRFNEQGAQRSDTVIRHFSMRIKLLPRLHTESIKPWQPELLHAKLGEYRYDRLIERWEKIRDAGYRYVAACACPN